MMMNRMKRILPVFLIICLITCMSPISFAAVDGGVSEGPSQIRLSWTEDPQTTMTVSWQDSANTERAWVEFTSGATLNQQPEASESEMSEQNRLIIREQAAQRVEHASTLSDGGTQWTATLTGLKPGTTYQYRIHSTVDTSESSGEFYDRVSGIHQFTTERKNSEELTFAYFGDIQVNQDSKSEFAHWGELARTAMEHNPDLQFGIMGGDIVESGISTEQFNMFFDAASPVFSGIPLFATNGNHESNFLSGKPELYLDSFSLPENGPEEFKEEFYSFDAGPAHILVLNSWVYSGEQKLTDEDYERISSWIRQDLQSAKDAAWKIVEMHHPLYAVHNDKVANLVQEHWGPILEENGVNLLLCGHQHVYCRSLPLIDGLTDPEHGITQVMGVSGEKFYSSADEQLMERTIYEVSNYQVIRMTETTLEIQCFDKDGQELDYAVLSATGSGNAQNDAEHFMDVTTGDWYYDAVDYVVNQALFNGVSDTEFSPQQTMTRAMFSTVLWRMNDSPEPTGTNVFSDVKADQWYTKAITWANEKGYISGYGDGLFGIEDPVTREQIATILFRYTSQDPEKNELAVTRGDLSAFTDRGEIADWAVDAMSWAVGIRMINGMGDGTLAPKGLATRAQVAQIIMNYNQMNA